MEYKKHSNGIPMTSPTNLCADCGKEYEAKQEWKWTSGVKNINFQGQPVIPSYTLEQCNHCDSWLLNMMHLINGGQFNVAVEYNALEVDDWVHDLNKKDKELDVAVK